MAPFSEHRILPVDDVTFAHNRPGKGNANGAYTKSDSPGGRTGDEVCDVCDCLAVHVNSACVYKD